MSRARLSPTAGGVAALLVLIGIATTLLASEPEKSAAAERLHAGKSVFRRLLTTVVHAFVDLFLR